MNIISSTIGNASQLNMMQEMNRMKTIADAPILAAPTISASDPGLVPSTEVSFHQVMGSALNHIDQLQQVADTKQNDVDMGKSDDLVGAMLASQQASLSFSALVQVRNKVASGVNDLMNMSV